MSKDNKKKRFGALVGERRAAKKVSSKASELDPNVYGTMEEELSGGVGSTGDPQLDEALSVRDRAAEATPEEAEAMLAEIDEGFDAAVSDIPPAGKGMKVFLILCILLTALIVIRFFIIQFSDTGDDTSASLTNVTVEEVSTGSISLTSPVSGRIQAVDTVDVFPMAQGEVTSVNVKVGDYVSAGQVLFTIDSTQAKAAYDQAQAQQSSARASYDQASVGYTTSQAQYKSALQQVETAKSSASQAQTSYDRAKTLYEAGTISKAELESAENALTNANAAVTQAELAADQAKEGINSAQASLQAASAGITSSQAGVTQATDALGNYIVKAPSSGYVNTVNVVSGSVVSSAAPAVSISDTSVLEMNAAISEYLINSINIGDNVDIYITSLASEPFSGVVSEVGEVPAAGSLTYPVKVRVTSGDSRIKAGMFAEVRFTSAKKDNVIIVPSEAVKISGGENYVYVLNGDDVAQKTKVTLGIDNGTIAEITGGLDTGDRIVVKGQDYIEDGESVNVVDGPGSGNSEDKES